MKTNPIFALRVLACLSTLTGLGGCQVRDAGPPLPLAVLGGGGVAWPSTRWAPMTIDPLVHVPILLRPGSHADPMQVEAVVDTGAEFGIVLPERLAAELGVRPPSPPSPPSSPSPQTASGAAGLAEVVPAGPMDVEVAGLRIVGVPVVIAPVRRVILGAECWTRAGGIAFDWAAGRFGVVARGGSSPPIPPPAPLPGWTTLQLLPSAHMDSLDPELRTIRIRLPYVRATLEGRGVLAMLDTGDTGEVRIPGPHPPSEPADREVVLGLGGRATVFRSRRAAPLAIGDPPAFQVRPTWMSQSASPGPADVVVGIGVLGRRPVWFDFDAAAVRFWRGDPATPGRGD